MLEWKVRGPPAEIDGMGKGRDAIGLTSRSWNLDGRMESTALREDLDKNFQSGDGFSIFGWIQGVLKFNNAS